MKYVLPYLVLLPLLLSCNAKPKHQADTDSSKSKDESLSFTGPFDLAKLELKENIQAIVKEQLIKVEPVTDTDKTLMGYDRVKSYDAKALKYGSALLSGADGNIKNYVLLHYDEKTNKLAFFEVILNTRDQANALHQELNKMGKPSFKKKWPDGSLTIDENGNAVPPKPDEKQIFQVWDNQRTGISYFYTEKENSKSFRATLTVLKESGQSGKDWMTFSGLDWYKNTKSD
jgi:hypothetical protein